MSEIKVSSKLLSWVFGCECEFGMIENNVLYYYYTDKKGLLQPDFENLDTFIRRAKIKAFECGHEFSCNSNQISIYNFEGLKKFKNFSNYSTPHSIEYLLEALEWIAEKVGGEK